MVAIVDELRRIPMSQRLIATLARSAEYAQAQYHAEVALEHLLLSLTEDSDAMQVLAASHVDLSLLKADVMQFLGGLSSVAYSAPIEKLKISPDLRRILEAAAAAASQGRRREINGAIVLAAIVGDGRSSAAHMLRAQGLTFEEAIRALQRAMAAPQAPADAEDILANARARVQNRTMPGLPPFSARAQREAEPAAIPLSEINDAQAGGASEPQFPKTASEPDSVPAATEDGADTKTKEDSARPEPVTRAKNQVSVDDFREAVSAEIGSIERLEAPATALPTSMVPPALDERKDTAHLADPRDARPEPISEFKEPTTDSWTPVAPNPTELPSALPTGLNDFDHPPPAPSIGAVNQAPALPARRRMPDPGSRWPAPVGPAWEKQDAAGGALLASPPSPPPLPASPVFPSPGAGSASHGQFEDQAAWPPEVGGHIGYAEYPDAVQSSGSLPTAAPAAAPWPEGYPLEGYPHSAPWPDPGMSGPPPLPPHTGPGFNAGFEPPFAEGAHAGDGYGHHPGAIFDPGYVPQPQGDFGHAYPDRYPEAAVAASQEPVFQGELPPQPPLVPSASTPGATGQAAHDSRSAASDTSSLDGAKRRRIPIDKVVAGQLVENIPRRMKAHVASAVEVRLARADAQRLLDGLAGEVHSHAVMVTPAMSVKLRAPDGGFIIDTASRETQWIENRLDLIDSDFAFWRWSVTPTRAGRQRLQLMISARTAGPDGIAADNALPDQIVEIQVSVNFGRAIFKVASWTAVAVLGGILAKLGDRFYEPMVANILKLLR